ncbi:porin family protein [Flavihumibacter sp. CACIAM 22H1]|uniref:porin family protein n=1 Tax=Flavihumibacter sp. CACIAM 22H1 TaxID=1812911 RepID=UPI0007A8D12A|nr:porin family protein [Flavihumibacter sp. CACIAM 22H1]KYP15082.1 MAG: hypothetical protein A1D16_02530 [Flavihumibacter sp. CACIAM 22H1]
MVIRIVPIVFLLFVSAFAFSQPVHWNIRAGWHASTAQIIDKSSSKKTPSNYLNGVSAGIGIKVQFDHQLYFSPRIQYSMHGFEQAATKNDPSQQYRLHYIELPILLQLDFSQKGQGFFTSFGPSVGGAIAGSRKTGNEKQALLFGMTQYNRVNIDALVQFGYGFKNGLSVDASYTYGLTSITNGDELPIIRMAQIGIGLSYRLTGSTAQK